MTNRWMVVDSVGTNQVFRRPGPPEPGANSSPYPGYFLALNRTPPHVRAEVERGRGEDSLGS